MHTIIRKIDQQYGTFALFHLPKRGSFMTPVHWSCRYAVYKPPSRQSSKETESMQEHSGTLYLFWGCIIMWCYVMMLHVQGPLMLAKILMQLKHECQQPMVLICPYNLANIQTRLTRAVTKRQWATAVTKRQLPTCLTTQRFPLSNLQDGMQMQSRFWATKHNPSAKSGLDACISSRITTIINVAGTIKSTITALITSSQFHRLTVVGWRHCMLSSQVSR